MSNRPLLKTQRDPLGHAGSGHLMGRDILVAMLLTVAAAACIGAAWWGGGGGETSSNATPQLPATEVSEHLRP
jgi:hypothetical protein